MRKKDCSGQPDKIFTAPTLLTCESNSGLKRKKELNDLGIIKDGAVAVRGAKIIEVGRAEDIIKKNKKTQIIKFKSGTLLPGFVDPHTHIIYAGSRVEEFYERLGGASYQEIHSRGGGILSTVKSTREASQEQLYKGGKKILRQMLTHGTTSLETKSGYGLDIENEIKTLKVIRKLKETSPQNIYSTFLGAHAIPEEYKFNRGGYVNLLIKLISKIKKEKLADFVDVFCEKGAFTLNETKKILTYAKGEGFNLKIHSEEFEHSGGTKLAVSLGAVSADHLTKITRDDIKRISKSSTVAVLLPGVTFFLGQARYSPARDLIDAGAAVALATDFNAGSCLTFSMQMIITLACLKMKMSLAEAINASTINAAAAIGQGHILGSIQRGKLADMILVDLEDINIWPFYFGTNMVKHVIKGGNILKI